MPLLVNIIIYFFYIFRHLSLSSKTFISYTKFVSRGKGKANVYHIVTYIENF